MKIMQLCKPYLLSGKLPLLLFVGLSFCGSLISIISPYLLGDFFDELISGANEQDILHFCMVFCGISVFKIVRDYTISIMYARMQVKMGYELNMHVIKHLQRLSLSYFNSQDTAYLNQRINGDCYSLISFCLTTLRDSIVNATVFIIPFIILLTLKKLILLIFMGFIVVYMSIYAMMRKRIYNAGLKYRESQAVFFASLFEQIKHVFRIKVDSVQTEFNSRTQEVFFSHQEASIKSQQMSYLYTSLDSIVATFAQISLFVVGGLLVIRGSFTVGMFTVFSSYFRSMLSSCRYFFGLAAAYQAASVSYDRIRSILDCREEPNGTIELQGINTIEMKDVSFSYATYNRLHKDIVGSNQNGYNGKELSSEIGANVIDAACHKFVKGKIYGITGGNGAGKSSLIKLLVGLYNSERTGGLYYNNIPVESIDLISSRKRLFGYAEQTPSLIEDSIYYNLTYNDVPNNPDGPYGLKMEEFNQLMRLVEVLNMKELVCNKTLAFKINASNTNLSGGEKQKIAILKLLWKNPDVMILDEPTAALDQETKKRLMQYLIQIKTGKIILIVTHDQEMISCCDQIVEMPMH